MAIDFSLSREQRDLRLEAREFARTHLTAVAAICRQETDPLSRFAATKPIYAEMVKAGYLRRIFPKAVGGDGNGMLEFAILAEEFMAVDVNVPITMFACMLGLSPLLYGGTPEQIGKWMPQFLSGSGTPLAAFGFSEPAGSANFASSAPGTGVATKVRREGDELIITGRKAWVSNAAGWDNTGAEVSTVVCRSDESMSPDNAVAIVIVPGGTEGILCEDPIDSMGHRAHLLPRVRYQEVRVPVDNLIGVPGDGVPLAEQSFTATAAVVGAFAVGVMREAFDCVLAFSKNEKRGGSTPIIDHQAVGYALADAKMKIDAIRAMTWRACFALDAEEPAAKELSLQTKIYSAETAVDVITKLMLVMGVSSYDHDHRIAALLQDACAFPLFDGGNLGVRRRQLHELMQADDYDPLTAAGVD